MIETPKTPSFWALWSWAGMHIGTWPNKADADAAMAEYTGATMKALYEEPYWLTPFGRFRLGDLVRKTRGSSWTGRVVGFYSTKQTPIGYAVESLAERGSVQIYPEAALDFVKVGEISEGWGALSCEEQHDLATRIAANIGYDLVPQPPYPDSPRDNFNTPRPDGEGHHG